MVQQIIRKYRQKRDSGAAQIRKCFIALVFVCLTFALSFAETHETLSQKLEGLGKIHGGFTFAVIGDTRSGGDDYLQLVRTVMEHKPDFVVNAGDMVGSRNKAGWSEFWEQSKAITVPYFLTVGNHDVSDKKSEALYMEQVDLPGNKLYYSFTVDDSLFIFLDSNMPGQDRKITGDQYKWLEQTLATSGQKYKFVFVHHPLYPEKRLGHHFGGSLDKYPEERDLLESLFVKYGVNIVFAGHEHLYLRKTVDGIMHIITGGGGASLYAGAETGGFYHFILIKVDEKNVTGKVIDISDKVKDTFER